MARWFRQSNSCHSRTVSSRHDVIGRLDPHLTYKTPTTVTTITPLLLVCLKIGKTSNHGILDDFGDRWDVAYVQTNPDPYPHPCCITIVVGQFPMDMLLVLFPWTPIWPIWWVRRKIRCPNNDGSDRHFSYAMAILGQSHIGLISYNHTTSIYPPPK